jgi:hypothetical protein
MTALFKKLNFKNHPSIVCVNAPASFAEEQSNMESEASIITSIQKVANISFALCFVTTEKQIDNFLTKALKKMDEDVTLWFCYPKASSKKIKCDFNRDTGWASVAQYNLEPVRQVAIDEDWSALRFRNVAFIKKITRKESYALTDAAKKRTSQKGK